VRGRLVALAIAALLWGGGAAAWVAAAGSEGSLQQMADEAHMVEADDEGRPARVGLGGVVSGVARTVAKPAWERRIPARIGWYGLATVGSILSPALAVVALLLGLSWLGGRREGARLAGVGLLGTAAFLLLLVRPIDERFVLTLAPALPLLAALGWSALPAERRGRWGVVAVAVGLLVAADFHHLPSTPLSRAAEPQPWARSMEPDEDNVLPPVRFRGLGAASSWERRGWGRFDESPPERETLRSDLLEALAACRPARIEQEEYAPVISEHGDLVWLEYAFALARARDGAPWMPALGTCGGSPAGSDGLVVLAADGPGGAVPPAACATTPPLRRWRRLDDPSGGEGVVLFTAGGLDPCDAAGAER
jgi:hypothetical protein